VTRAGTGLTRARTSLHAAGAVSRYRIGCLLGTGAFQAYTAAVVHVGGMIGQTKGNEVT